MIILAAPGLDDADQAGEGRCEQPRRSRAARLIAMAVTHRRAEAGHQHRRGVQAHAAAGQVGGSSDSASGVLLRTVLFPRLGVAEAAEAEEQGHRKPTSASATRSRAATWRSASSRSAELRPVPGITIVGRAAGRRAAGHDLLGRDRQGREKRRRRERLIDFLSSPAVAPVVEQTGLEPIRANVLSGAIDIHLHAEPDSRPRALDAHRRRRSRRRRTACARSC